MVYSPGRYDKHPAHCSECRLNFVPPAENPPEATTSGLRVDCPQCSYDFIWSVPTKFTVRCSECGLRDLIARCKPEWDDDGQLAVPCPGDDCDGHLRTPQWHDRRRRQRERRERDDPDPDVEELVPERVAWPARKTSGAIELPLRRKSTDADENPLPFSVSEAEAEQQRKLDRILNGRRRRDRY